MEVDRGAEIGALARALAVACAPGTRALQKSEARAVAEGESVELSFTAPSEGVCVRAIAVASPAIGDVDLELSDGSGRRLARGELEARFELAGPRGPVCVAAGPHRVRAIARRGAGELALEILVPSE
jgi:hypothetical protein